MHLSKFDLQTQGFLVQSQSEAKKRGHQAIEPEHFMWALLNDVTVQNKLKVKSLSALKKAIERRLEKKSVSKNVSTHLSSDLIEIAELAESLSDFSPEKKVTYSHVIQAILQCETETFDLGKVLVKHFSLSDFVPLQAVIDGEKQPSFLNQYTLDLTLQAKSKQLDPVIGRKKELERLIQVLSRRSRNNPVLVGEAGVGKSSIVRGLAQLISKNEVPKSLRGKRLLVLDIGAILAGATLRGQFEERIKSLLSELKQSQGQVLLFVDEIHSLVGAGGQGASDAANLLKPALARGEIQLLGASTPSEFQNSIGADKALERRFQEIIVYEPSHDGAFEILKGLKPVYEKFHRVKIEDEALKAAVHLSDRYIMSRALPQKAIDLLDEAASKLQIAKESKKSASKNVQADLIAEVVSQLTGIPAHKMLESEKQKLVQMESFIKERLIGQEEAVRGVSNAIRRSRAGLSDPKRPVGSFMFLGPTGVGKTELAKTLSNFLFDDEKAAVRFDMSEFMDKHSVSRLIGSPPGYEGAKDGGQLTEALRQRPYSVVLFDEIEKAHPEVLNLLLQILDDGRLTDSQGRLVSFNHAVIIMTSNVGAYSLLEANLSQGQIDSATKQKVHIELLEKFRPEFINRIDEVIYFHGLSRKHIEKIAVMQLKVLDAMLNKEKLKLEISDSAKKALIDFGFDVAFGARPLRRAIQKKIQDPLALALLEGRFKAGDKIKCNEDKRGKDEFIFTK